MQGFRIMGTAPYAAYSDSGGRFTSKFIVTFEQWILGRSMKKQDFKPSASPSDMSTVTGGFYQL